MTTPPWAVTRVILPALSINDVTLFKGASGTTNAVFTVSLWPPPVETATVQFATSNQTAIAGRDYVSTNGTLTFAPGMTHQTMTVPVIGSLLNETAVTFAVNLSRPTNAVLARAQGVGTILNDNPLPYLLVSDATVLESTSGTTNAVFNVSLSVPGGQAVTVVCYTSDGTALGGTDYVPISYNYLTFNPGQTNQTVSVVINSHVTAKPSQTFYLNFNNVANAKLARSRALGTIVTAPPGRLDHLAWSGIASPQSNGVPFGVTISAQDYYNTTVSNFAGPVALSGSCLGAFRTNMIIGNVPYSYYYGSGNYITVGYSFTPNKNLLATTVRSYFGTKVSIWTDAGVLLASQNVTSVPGTWVETPLSTPVQLLAGQRYRLGVYTAGLPYYQSYDPSTTFNDGTIDQGCESSGDGFPNVFDGSEWWMVDIRYTVGIPVPLPVTPTNSASFANGVWNGNVTAQLPATNVTLLADDGQGHTGTSNPFDVVPTRGQTTHFVWSTIPSRQTNGLPFSVTISAQDYYNTTASNFTGTVALSGEGGGGGTTNKIFGDVASASYSSGTYTMGFAFTPNTNIVVTHVRSYSGTKVSIWTATGTLLASQPVSGTAGTWTETPLTTPLTLSAGVTYQVGFYTGGGAYYYYSYGNSFPTAFANGTIPGGGSYYTGSDAFPTTLDSGYFLLVDLKYTVGGQVPVTIMPTSSGNFVNGVWSGSITAQQRATNVTLQADDGQGHTGTSNPFDVVPASGVIDHFVWSAIPSPRTNGVPFSVTISAQDYYNTTASNFTGTVALSGSGGGGATTNKIFGDVAGALDGYGTYTMGFAFTPNTNIVVTHVRSYSGTKVSIWTATGTLLASQPVSGTAGTWTETPLTTPLTLSAGVTYRVGFYTGGGAWYYYSYGNSFPTTFANGTILGGGTYVTGSDAFPTSWLDSGYFYLVDLKYTVGGQVPVTIMPTNSGNFVNGVWSGSITAQQRATNVTLLADDGQGHTGTSNPFDVVPASGVIDHFVWSAIPSPRTNGVPFGVTISAQDYYNTTASNFTGTASLLAMSASGSRLPGGSIVPYFTDNNPSTTGPQGPITQAGFTPLQVTDIGTLNLQNYSMLFVDEEDNGSVSSALLGRLADIRRWVTNGGRLIVHDRSAGNLSPSPFLLGTAGITPVRFTTSDIDVIPPGMNLVVAGPFGTINNSTLDGGNSSAHGYVPQDQLPPSASAFLSIGGEPSQVVAFSYSLGSGQVYYSSIPLDCYLEGGGCGSNVITGPLQNIYTPNVLAYVSSVGSLQPFTIIPTNSGNFVNGVWNGSVTVQQPATSVILQADDGQGHTGSSNPFSVIAFVPPQPVFQSWVHTGNALTFTYSALSGQVYQLQYKTNLNQVNWFNLGSPIPATNSVMSASDAVGSDPQRFYRITVLP